MLAARLSARFLPGAALASVIAVAVLIAASCEPSGGSSPKGGDIDSVGVGGDSAVDSGGLAGIDIEMVFVAGGAFLMGCDGRFYDDCSPTALAHEVSVSGFQIGKREVTQELWRAVMGTNPSEFTLDYEDGDLPDKRPVETVSWNDAQAFISKLNKATGKEYRLPTEAEWEYAARGGAASNNYLYSGGNDIGAVAWYGGPGGNSAGKTSQTGGKQPNELGIYDMSGNVGEWVADWHDADYYASSPRNDPQGPLSSPFGYRVYRGGNWSHRPVACLVFYRNFDSPDSKQSYIGFRLAHP
jgi:formylglycine-generating enzyme required for sulfatase activity